jgi:aldehyde dehydrogenase family 7 protein A1
MLRSTLSFTARPIPLGGSRRYLSSRATRVLSALNLPGPETPLSGVYDGQWKGSGEEMVSKCPATGEVIGRIRSVSDNSILRTPHRVIHVATPMRFIVTHFPTPWAGRDPCSSHPFTARSGEITPVGPEKATQRHSQSRSTASGSLMLSSRGQSTKPARPSREQRRPPASSAPCPARSEARWSGR